MTDELIVKIVAAVLGSGAFSALVSGIMSYLNEKRKDKKGSGKLIMMLTARELYQMGEKFVSQGYADNEELKLFTDMFKIYKEQDGNGYADALKDRVDKLPIKK